MEATKQQIASIFNGHRILEVPFYQRSYVWQEEQWRRFLEDMEFITHCSQDYFLGSIILKQQQTDLGEANDRRTIIDGQQRFTTLILFAKALCLKTDDMETFNQHFIVRNKKKGTRNFALRHSLNDMIDFEKVLSISKDEPIQIANNSNIIKAYNYFQKEIDITKLDIDVLLAHIVFIAIELQQQDDEQVIFDTINSLGMRLTTAELLKNYFFTDKTREEYEVLWMPVFEEDRETFEYWDETLTSGRIKRTNIDAFFAAFLSIKVQDPLLNVDAEHKSIYRRADSIFSSYKDLISTYKLDKLNLLYEIMEYAEFYKKHFNWGITSEELPSTPSIERIVFLICVLDTFTALPYVLYVLRNVSDEAECNAIFEYLETYIVRRVICKSDTRNYSDFFNESLIGNKILTAKALKEYISRKSADEALAIPFDWQVKNAFNEVDHPNKRALAILYLMESRLRANKKYATKLHCFDNYTLEHLMPKKYKKNWPLIPDFDEDTRKFMINTLGNMAILPSKLNTSISNASWQDKKNGRGSQKGLKEYASDLITMKTALTMPQWNEFCIEARAAQLANIAIRIWPLNESSFETTIPEEIEGKIEELPTPQQCEPLRIHKKEISSPSNRIHNMSRYSFDNKIFLSKSEFVLQVVSQYIKKHPNLRYNELQKIFNDRLCPNGYKFLGFLCSKQVYDIWDNGYKERRYQPNRPGGSLQSADGVIFYVNTQWVASAMPPIIKIAEKEGFTIYIEEDKK